MTAPTVPTAPLPSELQEALNRHALFVSAEYTTKVKKDWATIYAALLTMRRERDVLRAALLDCARQAEALKRPCGDDPESPQAIRNGQYASISATAHVALGTCMGPPSATLAETNSLREQLAACERTCAELRELLQDANIRATEGQCLKDAANHRCDALKARAEAAERKNEPTKE